MGINKKKWLFSQITAASPSNNTEDIFNSDLEETFYAAVNQGTLVPFSPKKENVRINALSVPTWIRKKQLSLLNQSPCRVLCIGDSTTAGVYSDSYTTATGTTNQGGPNSYPSQLASRLTALGLPSDYAMAIPGHSGNTDSRWTLDANWSYSANFAGDNACLTSPVANAVLKLTPNVVADTYKVYFWSDNANTFSLQATGAATATTVDSVAARGTNPAQRLYNTTVTATSASSANVLTIINLTGQTFIAAVEYWNSANPNHIRILNAGVGSSTSTNWADTSYPQSYGFITAIQPDLTIISLGINDAGASVPASTVLSNIQSIANTASLSGDVILMSALPHSTAGLVDQYNLQYYSSIYPYIDIENRWKNSAKANGLITTDDTHPNALGYGDLASIIANILLQA